MQTIGLYEYKVVGSGCGFNRKRGLAETDIYFIQIMLDFLSVCLGLPPPPASPPHTHNLDPRCTPFSVRVVKLFYYPAVSLLIPINSVGIDQHV